MQDTTAPVHMNAKCGICLEEMNKGEDHRSASIPCGHVFDEACLYAWLEKGGGKCPHCCRVTSVDDIIPLFLEAPLARGSGLADEERARILEICDKACTRVAETRSAFKTVVNLHQAAAQTLASIEETFNATREMDLRAREAFKIANAAMVKARTIPKFESLADPTTKFDDMPVLDENELQSTEVAHIEAWATMDRATKTHSRVCTKRRKASTNFQFALCNMIESYRMYYGAMKAYKHARDAVERALG